MQDATDTELLRKYVDQNSEEAFAELVSRYVNVVYSAALRKTGNPGAAEEIAQAVFIILAKKAAQLRAETILSGWLYETARLTSIRFLRTEFRRTRREQEVYMQSLTKDPDPELWPQIAPLLEDAMGKLNEYDRNAIALRFFQGKSFSEIAAVIGASENAAKKRVAYALEKLRKYFSGHGVSSTATILAGTLSANSVQAAPIGFAKTLSAVAFTKGATASTSTLTLIKGAMKVMAWTKMKTAVIVGATVILAAGSATGLVVHHQHRAKNSADISPRYATPEAAFESAFSAMSRGDIKTLHQSYTAEFRDQFMATAGKGKSEKEIVALFVQISGMLQGFQFQSNQPVSADEAILHIRSPRFGNASVPLKKIGDEWKLNGNIVSDPEKGRR